MLFCLCLTTKTLQLFPASSLSCYWMDPILMRDNKHYFIISSFLIDDLLKKMMFLIMLIEALRSPLTWCWLHIWHSLIKWQMTVLRFKKRLSFESFTFSGHWCSWQMKISAVRTNTFTPAHLDSSQRLFGTCWGLLERKVRFERDYN